MKGGRSPIDPGLARRFHAASRVAGAVVAGLGAAVLGGWAFDIEALKSLHPSLVSMKANTAAGFLLTGAAVWLEQDPARRWRRWTSWSLAAAVALLGAATLLEYAARVDLGIDQLLAADSHGAVATSAPGRMSPAAAVHFALIGASLLLLDVVSPIARPRPTECLAAIVGLSSLLFALGYLYGVPPLYSLSAQAPVAPLTAVGFLVSAAAVLLSRPELGTLQFAVAPSPGGVLARRMLPAAILVPGALGWLALAGTRRGLFGVELGLALFAASSMIFFTGMVLWIARALHRADVARRRAEQAVRAREADLAITLDSIGEAVIATDRRGRIVRMNPVAEELTGWAAADAAGRAVEEVFRIVGAAAREPVACPVERVLREGSALGAAEEVLLIARGGGERVIAESGAPIRDADGVVRGAVLVFRDRTAARAAEQTLRESEARKAAVLEAALDCIVTMDHTGAIVEFNQAAERIFGHARADVIGKRLSEVLVPPALRERHDRGLERYLAGGDANIIGRRIEVSAMRADGSEFPAEVTVVRIRSAGAPMFTGYIRDITERRGAAEALRASEARFRRLVESGLIGIVVARADGAIEDANDAFLQLVGSSHAEIDAGALRWSDIAPAEWRELDQAARELELRHRSGDPVPVLLGVTRLDEVSTIAFVLDLTERKQAEAAIKDLRRERAADAKFRALLEAAPDAMVILDQDSRIALVNSEAERVFGHARHEMLGQPVDLLFSGGRFEPEPRAVGSSLVLRGRRKDGSEFPIEVSSSPIETEEGMLLSSAIRDVSERKEAEEHLRRAKEEAEIAMGELEAFSYSVAHDLRSPLRSINGFSSAILEDWGNRLDEDARGYLARIMGGAERMGQLIDALLTLARVSRTELQRETVDLTQLARAVMAQLRTSHPERGLELALDEDMTVEGDPQLLRVLLENLLGNAWKFAGQRELTRIEFGCAQGDADVYYVRDNGAGFDMRYASKLFTPFQRLHTASEFAGTGIGLATVQRIVRRHGGRIWAEAAVEQGATFHFTLAGPSGA
jgi:PAS domain S-box-containing protein